MNSARPVSFDKTFALMNMMQDEDVLKEIARYRTSAQALGDAALEAMQRGDIGLARTSARQAAQYARVALQLETGEKQVEPETEDDGPPAGLTG
jgi:hypothetical protein